MDTLFSIVVYILLGKDAIVNAGGEAASGQLCPVVYGGLEQFLQPVRPD